jgi:putative ABC transport system permease protein
MGNNLLGFQSLKDIHLNTDFTYWNDHNPGNPHYVYLFSILAILIVLMGTFNFMTISTAQAAKRTKEVAVRKVNGGNQNELMGQFYFETLIHVCIAMLLALVLTHFFLSFLNSFTHKEMTLNFSTKFWIMAGLSLVCVCLVAGSYSALYLSSYSPVMIFKRGNSTGRKTGFIRLMVVVQFVISISLIICTLVVFRQLSYITNKDLGIDRENIITTRCGLWYNVETFKQEVMRNPNVLSVSMSFFTPESFSFEMKNVTWEGKITQDTVQMNMAMIDGDFAKTYGLQVVSGELLKTSNDDFWNNKGGGAMINETAARMMGMDNPVGKTINNQRIVAVVRDFHFRSLKEPVLPLIMTYSMEAVVNINFKLAPGNQQSTISFIKETYERMRPGTTFEYRYFKDQIAELYQTENQLGVLFLIFTFLSLIIACLGILGLTAISTEQRTKEIGLRKIAGASVTSIMLLLNKNYATWIAIAFIIAVPPTAILMNHWLQVFAYHIPLSWWIFLLAGLITLTIAIATISWLCFKAARQNPVNLLRDE